MKKPFTPEEDAMIIAMWPTAQYITDIGKAINRGATSLSLHAKNDLGLPARSKGGRPGRRYKAKPSKKEWVEAVTKHALRYRATPSLVLAGDRQKCCVRARRAAWKEILNSNPCYSVTGLADVCGFDYSTITYSLGRLNGRKPAGYPRQVEG